MISQQLQVFLQVAECGSFSKAAQKMMVTPASVMKHMNTLEERLGVKLVKRSSQGIKLTAAGKSLYKDGKKLAALAENAVSRAKNAERSEGITIRVGSSLLNPSRVLTDLWAPLREKYPQYKFHIVPYQDTKEQILSVISSLGERIDLLVGAFNSKTMRKAADYLNLGEYRLCVAVPERNPLASRKELTLRDLYGERLMMVKGGDTELLDHFHHMLTTAHSQIQVEEAGYYYDMDTFNTCEQTGSLLLTLDAWASIHPSLVTILVKWDYRIPYGILYAKTPSDDVKTFISIIKVNMRQNSCLQHSRTASTAAPWYRVYVENRREDFLYLSGKIM